MTYQQATADAINQFQTMDVDAASVTTGFGSLSFSSAATRTVPVFSTDVTVITAVVTGFGSLSFSSAAVATTTAAANQQSIQPVGSSYLNPLVL